ncbi:MAG: hypothetical protein M4579_001450 [Chaenotheca gracillima]|nr:MAG: hypothetical protein M4579_001450 [Chaenotheca gracillima]
MSSTPTPTPRLDDEGHGGYGAGGANGQPHDRIGRNPQDAKDVEISAGQKMIAALSGSFLTSVLVTPMDVVRVRLQSQGKPSFTPAPTNLASSPQAFANLPSNVGVTACCREVFWLNNYANVCVATPGSNATQLSNGRGGAIPAVECAAEETQRRTFTSTLDALRKIARHEGLSSLWRGLSPTLAMSIPGNVIYFTGYDWLRYDRRSPLTKYVSSDVYTPLVAGSVARMAAATAISPIEMFRTRLQASSTGGRLEKGGARILFVDTLKGLNDMVRSEGITSLWRGLVLTLWRDVPFSAIYWFGYETTRDYLSTARAHARGRSRDDASIGGSARARSLSRSRETHATTFADSFTAGAVSGAIAAFVTMPFDVGKTRQQIFKHSRDGPPANAPEGSRRYLSPEERSMPRFLWHIFKEEGLIGLWRGCTARCLKVAPACAIMISSYEIGKKMAKSMNEKKDNATR